MLKGQNLTSNESYLQSRGKQSEKRVVDYFSKMGFQLIGERLRLLSAELDLLFKDVNGELVAVEVKSVTGEIEFVSPISKAQMSRLSKAMLEIECQYGQVPRLHLAAVSQSGKVFIYEDFLEELA